MNMKVSLLVACVVALGLEGVAARSAVIREETTAFPTYAFDDPDPVPRTDQRIYPYFRYDGSSDKAESRSWRTVVLENENIRVTILPEIGGKIWGAFDKKSGRDFIYFNHAVKFRDIAQRGPWCSGGIEFNFGILGHSPTTATPVDWCTETNRDGSVSYFASATEYVNRTTWQVEVRLMPSADFFYTRTTWFNGSNLPQPYYQWMTAAYSARGNPRLYFPGSSYIGHQGDAHAWPIDERGRDLSRYADNAFDSHKSYHVLDGDSRLFAIWWPEAGMGSIHQNAIYDKYGRKIWMWAQSREGAIWEDLLTDSDGQYIELQSGRVFNQPQNMTYRTPFKHPTFAPGITDTFDERWGVARDERELQAKCNPTNYVSRPHEMPADFDWDSIYGLYLRGEQAVRERDDETGEKSLRACLAKDGNFAPALTVLAGLQARRGKYDEVRSLCARALALNTYDPAANYLDGLAALAADELECAKERFGLAGYSPEYRASAFVGIAKARMRGWHWDEARAAADRALLANPSSPDAFLVRIACLRKAGHAAQAISLARLALTQWPLFHGARHELDLLGVKGGFRDMIRNELPNQTFLELGSWYEDAGLFDEARALFARAGQDPIARIRTAYLDFRVGHEESARAGLLAAAKLPAGGVFPFRRETRAALQWAVGQEGAPWKIAYWMAVYLAANGDGAEADRLLDGVDGADEDVFYLFRATRRKGAARRADLLKAKSLKRTWRVYHALAAHEAAEGTPDEMLKTTTEGVMYFAARNPIQMDYARALVKCGRFKQAVEYLGTIRVLPSETGDNAHDIWTEAWTGLAAAAERNGDSAQAARARAQAAEWPENLGAGKPYSREDEKTISEKQKENDDEW